MPFSPERLAAEVDHGLVRIDRSPAGLCVALSGGLDSTVLLAALAQLRDSGRYGPLRAIHVNHGLHADAEQWLAECRALCARLTVPFDQVTVDARPRAGESTEAAARAVRYSALVERIDEGEALLTAHHADDQLEGVLLQWLRGGGLRALAGMAPIARFGRGWHLRPLLAFTRSELEAWAREAGLDWLEDPSNRDRRFDRNYLRLEVLPALRRRWPSAARTIGRVAVQAHEALDIVDAVAMADVAAAAEGVTLAMARLRVLPPPRRRAALRAWLRSRSLPIPAAATLAALEHDMIHAGGDRVPCVQWPGATVHRYRDRLYAGLPQAAPSWSGATWRRGHAFDLGAFGRLELEAATGAGLSRARLPAELQVRARTGGARFTPEGGAHRRPLRKWMQERGILPWLRPFVPLVVAGDEVVAIGDLAHGAAFAAGPDEPSWRIAWHDRPTLTEAEATSGFEVAGTGPIR